jgi:hypothetical protein
VPVELSAAHAANPSSRFERYLFPIDTVRGFCPNSTLGEGEEEESCLGAGSCRSHNVSRHMLESRNPDCDCGVFENGAEQQFDDVPAAKRPRIRIRRNQG